MFNLITNTFNRLIAAFPHDDLSFKVFNVRVFDLRLLHVWKMPLVTVRCTLAHSWWFIQLRMKEQCYLLLKKNECHYLSAHLSCIQKVTVSSWVRERFDLRTVRYLTEIICKVDRESFSIKRSLKTKLGTDLWNTLAQGRGEKGRHVL